MTYNTSSKLSYPLVLLRNYTLIEEKKSIIFQIIFMYISNTSDEGQICPSLICFFTKNSVAEQSMSLKVLLINNWDLNCQNLPKVIIILYNCSVYYMMMFVLIFDQSLSTTIVIYSLVLKVSYFKFLLCFHKKI